MELGMDGDSGGAGSAVMEIRQIEEKTIDEFREEWSQVVQEIRWDRKLYFFGGFDGNKLIVYIKFDTTGGVGHLSDLIVRKQFRGKKYGYGLIKYFIEFCKARGCHKLTITTSEKHLHARNIYERLGFRIESEHRDDKFHLTWYTYSVQANRV